MRRASIIVVAGCLCVSGCGRAPVATPGAARNPGRFAGIGVFDAGRLWAEIAGAPARADAASARLADDEHVIVVLDSHTGEVRECGDHSGFCVGMNPWTAARVALPARLARHAADLAADEQAEADSTAR